ncbi:hypothetical protein JTB14_025431 [Gonioctena quinquepunctata]|nr:hypothetical protein JTB14_025431 [Gonioctena quinquepunctata]
MKILHMEHELKNAEIYFAEEEEQSDDQSLPRSELEGKIENIHPSVAEWEHQSNISDHANDQYDFGYSETQPNQYKNFQDFPIGPISFDPPINQSIDPTSELQAQVQALNISDNLNPNLNFPEQMFL